MAKFGKLQLTNAGINAQARAQAGNKLEFSLIKMGSGEAPRNVEELVDLVSPKLSAGIVASSLVSGVCTVEAHFTNEGLTSGFYWREIGLYCKDESGNDVLYAYANAATTTDYIPATISEIYSKHVRIATAVGSATNITITLNSQTFIDLVTYTEGMKKKVDKVDGKGLSTEDYTTEDKKKLAGIADGANKYTLPIAKTGTLGGIKASNSISVSSDGTAEVKDNSHLHTIENIGGLKTQLENIAKQFESVNKTIGGLATTEALESVRKDLTDALADEVRGLEQSITNLTNSFNSKYGTADISGIGDGTLSGAIAELYRLVSAIPSITSGTSEPSGGKNGDVYIMHE